MFFAILDVPYNGNLKMQSNFYIFVRMKTIQRFVFFVFLLLFHANFAQDLETRFYSLTDISLPTVFVLEESTLLAKMKKISFSSNLQVTSSNYWQPVNMLQAMEQQSSYLATKASPKKEITAESLGFQTQQEKEADVQIYFNNARHSRRQRVRNSVYQDVSQPFLYNPFYYRNTPGTAF